MREKDCKIIKDLFPSYIDGLTDEVTNQYIEEHLKQCEKCRNVLESMKKELNLDTTQKDSKEVKYIKKFNKKMKVLKMILIGILLIFLLSYARKIIIIAILNSKVSNYTNSTNYYIKSLNYAGESLIVIENYKKGDSYIRKLKTLSRTSKSFVADYYNGETINSYSEVELEEENVSRKMAKLNSDNKPILPVIPNEITNNNLIRFVLTPLFSSITSEKCNERDCYRIVVYSVNDVGGTIYYIDKETGLTIRVIAESTINTEGEQYDIVTDFQYNFDVVTDNDFIEPDISEYEIEE